MKCFGHISATPFDIRTEQGAVVLSVPDFSFALVNEADVDGATVLSLPSGESISIAPDGSVQTRPAGTQGPWERGVVDGGIITYTPDPASGICYVFGLRSA